MQKDIDAQVQITQIFSAQAPRLVASYADSQKKHLNDQAGAETDPTRKTALQAEAQRWEEGGLYRVALHTTVGGLAGGTAGAAGAGTVAAGAPVMNALQNSLIGQLTDAGVNPTVAHGAAQIAALITATAAGAVAGGGTPQGAARIRPDATVIKNADGTYTAPVQIFDMNKGEWVDKLRPNGTVQPSTFFPPSWSEARITYEVSEAFKKRNMISASKWEGTTPSGLRIEGYINPNRVTFFPMGLR